VLASFARAAKPHRWYVFGAQAVGLYGVPRTTADIDVTADVKPGDVAAFVRSLAAAGFVARVPNVRSFVAATRVLPLEHRPTGFPVDVVLSGPGVEEMFLAAARRVRIGAVSAPVISREHLIVTKLLAGRPKDLEDVRVLLQQVSPGLDLGEVRKVLHALERGLDRSDLVPLFEKLRSESKLKP
jgi:uncharacterized nucleotidyltransferase DUF6036